MKYKVTISTLKVITVEDSLIVAERMKSMLVENRAIEFLGNATSTSEALGLIAERLPHVVILDIHLRGDVRRAGGIDLLVTIRKMYPTIKIIMLTSLTDEHYRNACLSLGADYFFDKSNEFDKVPDVLRKMQQ